MKLFKKTLKDKDFVHKTRFNFKTHFHFKTRFHFKQLKKLSFKKKKNGTHFEPI